MKYLRAFKNKQDYSKEIGDKPKIDYSTVSLVLDDESVFFDEYVTREAYFYVTEQPSMEASLSLEESEVTSISPQSLESDLTFLNDYRMFSEIYLNDGTENLVPKLVEGSFTIDANDLEQIDEMTWRNANPKKYNSTYVNSFIVSCNEEILDDYYIGFSGLIAYSGGGGGTPMLLANSGGYGMLMRDITLMGTLNELFDTPTLKEIARIDSNTIDLTDFFINEFGLVSSLNVVVFKPGENDELIPLTTTNTYVSNIIEEKTYDVSETQRLEDFFLMDFTLKCEEGILSTDTLFTYENNEIVSLYTIEEFLTLAHDNGLGIDLIDSKTLGPVNGYFPDSPYIRLCGIIRDGEILTQKVNIVGVNSYEYGNYSLPIDKLGEAKIEFKIPNRFKTPSFYQNYNLISLNDKALKDNKVIVPNAFSGCYNLTNVTIPDSVTLIGESAFSGCSSLTSITIPDSVTTIGDRAFYNCQNLKSITIPDSVTSIGEYAFYYCTNLTRATIPDSVTTIADSTFHACYNLTSVNIPDSVTSIGDDAFYKCTSLTSVTIPDSVTSIGNSAFYSCNSLTSIRIPDSVTSIGTNAFKGCSGELIVNCNIPSASSSGYGTFCEADFTKVTIGDGVTSIGDYAFYGCGLKNVIIPDSVTSIGTKAFYESGLTSVTIGSGVTSIGNSAFEWCTNFISAYCKASTPPSLGGTSVFHVLYKIYVPEGSLQAYKTDEYWSDYANFIVGYDYNSTTTISYTTSDGMPANASGLIISNNYQNGVGELTYIGKDIIPAGIFAYCTDLTSVTIPDSVKTIGNRAFYNCQNLKSITIPDSVTSIGGYAFYYCTNLTRATIPDSVTTIGNGAFSGCDNLTSVNIPDSVTTIGNGAFSGCDNLTSITIPDSVTTIGNNTFYYCTSLSNVTIPNSVTSIGDYAFFNCQTLGTITCLATTAPSLGTNSFTSIGSNGTLRVPTGSDYTTWKNALPYGWAIEYIE